MSMIEDIKRDREAGTPGPWETTADQTGIRHHEEPPYGAYKYIAVSVAANSTPVADARRIARVPDMEAALIAAEELANGSEGNIESDGVVYAQIPVSLIDAYRAATGEA